MKRPQVVSAAVAGTSHLRRDLPCQDAVAWQVTAGGYLLAALADGAGSAALAEEGSAAAVAGAIAHLQDVARANALGETVTDWGVALTAALAAARGKLVALAEERQLPLREVACTAIVLVADGAGVAVAQVGDGAAVAREADGTLRALTVPPVGEYANVCPFLSDEDWESSLQSQVWSGPVAGVALFSDGLQRLALKLPEGEPFAPFFAPLFAFVGAIGAAIDPDSEDDRQSNPQDNPERNPQAVAQALRSNIAAADESLAAFLRSPRLSERTDDDLSLLLAVWPL